MTHHINKIGFLVFLLFSLNLFAQKEINTTLIDSLFNDFNNDVPGASIMIIKQDSVLINKSYGLSNVEFRFSAWAGTNYRMASVSKQFTAMAILQLIEQKKINFDTTLKEIFPDFNNYANEISIQHLLTHTSGLPDYENLMKEDRSEPILDPEILAMMKQQDSTYFKPGTQYRYSNTAYAILAQIVEKITGSPFREYMRKNIFGPLHMDNSSIYAKGKKIKNRAFGYEVKNGEIHFADQSMTSAVQGDGGVYTSLNDYYKWTKALQDHKLISIELQKKAWSPQYFDKEKNEGYGYGWRIKFEDQTKIISHSGHTSGFTNYVVKLPAKQLSVIIFSNRRNNDKIIKIGDYLLALLSDGLLPIPDIKSKD